MLNSHIKPQGSTDILIIGGGAIGLGIAYAVFLKYDQLN